MAVVSVNGIYKSFGATSILEDVSFSVNKNEKIAIIGDNGEGKTTLLKIMTKELEADKGSVYFEDSNSVGYLSQQVIDNVEKYSNSLRKAMTEQCMSIMKCATNSNELTKLFLIDYSSQKKRKYHLHNHQLESIYQI